MKTLPAILYWIAAIGCLIGRLMTEPLSIYLDYIFKPLLMPLLALMVWNHQSYSHKILLMVALFFAWGGDMALMLGRDGLMFIAGLGCFLVMQVLYILLFKKDWGRPSFLRKQPFWALPVIAIGACFYILSIPQLIDNPVMLIAVFVYATALVSMTLSAINRQDNDSPDAWQSVYIGAILFLASDLMIGASKFIIGDFPFSSFAIMLTYTIGQYMIVKGLLKQGPPTT